jgi:hypothetical protein
MGRKAETYQQWRLDNPSERKIVQDVFEKILNEKKSGGMLTFPPQSIYSVKDHQEEIRVAEILQESIGGDMVLLAERNYKGLKTSEYMRDDTFWGKLYLR